MVRKSELDQRRKEDEMPPISRGFRG